MTEDQSTASMAGKTMVVARNIGCKTGIIFGSSVRAAIAINSRAKLESGCPPILVDETGRIWIHLKGVSRMAERLRLGAARLIDESALADQVGRIADDPTWAGYKGSGDRIKPGVRVRLESGRRVVYRRLSAEVSERLLTGD